MKKILFFLLATLAANNLSAQVLCVGADTTLSGGNPDSAWTSSNVAVATVDAAAGVVTGIAAGTATIYHGVFIATLTVVAPPEPITGAVGVLCVGEATALSETVTGGTWSSSGGGTTADVNSSGDVVGISSGTATLTISYTNACGVVSTTRTVTVNTCTGGGTTIPDPSYFMQHCYPCDLLGDPVDVATGAYSYWDTDINIPAVNTALNVTRFYNTVNASLNGPMGYGWSNTYDCYVTNIHDSLWRVHYGDGHSTPFIPAAGLSGTSLPLYGGTYETLRQVPPAIGNFKLTFKTGIVYTFNSSLQLASITDLDGNVTTLNYTSGKLTSVVAPGGRTLTFTYSGTLITGITDPLGRTVSYSYDGSGNLVHATDPDGGVTTYSYNANHGITQVVTRRGNILVNNTYDALNRVINQTDALGNATAIAYNTPSAGNATITYPGGHTQVDYQDAYSRLVKETDELGNNKLFAYDNNHNPDSITDENGNTTTNIYDSLGNCLITVKPTGIINTTTYNTFNKPVTIVDPLGNTSTLSYDTHGNVTSIAMPDGAITNYTYYTNGLMHTAIDALGNVTTYNYSAAGDLTSVVSPAGTKTFTYDLAGRRMAMTDEDGHTTAYTYNNDDMVTMITDALGATIHDSFDADNNLIYAIDKNGNHTQYTYDAKDRLSGITDARGGHKSFTYDARDNLVTATDADGHVVTYGYDAKKRLIATTTSLGTTAYGYDPNSNNVSETDALGYTISYTYDALNRRTAAADALGNTESFTYSALGQVTAVQDPLGRNTGYTYNSVGLLTGITDAAGHITAAGYDLNGNRTSITDPNGHTQSFAYDASNRLSSYTDGAGNVYGFTYDGVGNALTQAMPGGGTITKTYSAVNNVTNVANSTGDNYTYTYDANGNRLTAANTTGTSSFAYDSLNHLKQYTDMFGNSVQYTYDLAGNKNSVVYPGAHTVSYSYNNENMMDSVTDWLGHITRYNYDADGRLATMVYPNGAICNYAFDNAGRLTSLADSLSSGLINKSIFTLDADGNRIQEQRKGPIPFHLTAASFAYTYGNDDRLTSDSVTAYSNNPAGNRTSEVNTGGTTSYTFSVDNILNSYTSPTLGTTTFLYDALGNRMQRTQGGITRRFVLDLSCNLSQVLMEQDNTGVVKADYIYGLGLIARIDSAGNMEYYHFDAQHNTVALSNQAGVITDTYTYDPFGMMLKHTGPTNQPCTFMGEYGVQQETPTLYYVRARYYDAANGRFLSKDSYPYSLSDPQTLNRYVYALNNPLSQFDPTGLCSLNCGNNDNDLIDNLLQGIDKVAQLSQSDTTSSISSNDRPFKVPNFGYPGHYPGDEVVTQRLWFMLDYFVFPIWDLEFPFIDVIVKSIFKKDYVNSENVRQDIYIGLLMHSN